MGASWVRRVVNFLFGNIPAACAMIGTLSYINYIQLLMLIELIIHKQGSTSPLNAVHSFPLVGVIKGEIHVDVALEVPSCLHHDISGLVSKPWWLA